MEISEFKELKEKIEAAKTKRAKAESLLEESMSRLKKEFDCNSIEEAEGKLSELRKEIDSDEDKLDKLLDEIEEETKWIKD